MFCLCDQVLLFGRGGRVVFSGPPRVLGEFLELAGHACDPFANPAEFGTELMSEIDEAQTQHLVLLNQRFQGDMARMRTALAGPKVRGARQAAREAMSHFLGIPLDPSPQDSKGKEEQHFAPQRGAKALPEEPRLSEFDWPERGPGTVGEFSELTKRTCRFVCELLRFK